MPLILNELTYHTRHVGAAFICLQEVLHEQLSDILHKLNGENPTYEGSALPAGPLWAHIGVAREDGHTKGEYSPIIYPVQSFSLLHFENQWLSPTPDRPSKGWDAGCKRILTAGIFEHKATGYRVLACCTHLDNQGSESREKSVGLILNTIKRLREKWPVHASFNDSTSSAESQSIGVFLAGDFNSLPDQEPYLAMRASDLMCDLRDYVRSERRYGDQSTFTGFDPDKENDERGRIDFMWLGPKQQVSGDQSLPETGSQLETPANSGWRVDGYAVLPNVFEDGVYSSDHRCVVGDVTLCSA